MSTPIRSRQLGCWLGLLTGLSTILAVLLFVYAYEWLPKNRALNKLKRGVSDLDFKIQSSEYMIRDSSDEYIKFWRRIADDFETTKGMASDAIKNSDLDRFETPVPVMCKIVLHPASTEEEPQKEPRLWYIFYWFEMRGAVNGVFFRTSDGQEQIEVAPMFCGTGAPPELALRWGSGCIYTDAAASQVDSDSQNAGAPSLVFTQDDLCVEIEAGLILADGTRTSTIPVRVSPSATAPLEPHDSTQEHEAEAGVTTAGGTG